MKRSLMVFLSVLLVSAVALGFGMTLGGTAVPLSVGGDERAEWDGTVEPRSLSILIINPEHWAALEKLGNARADLIAAGVPLVDFGYRVGRVVESVGDLVVEVGLREVKDEYKELIKAIVQGIEGIEFDFFQARFTQEQISRWQDDIFETFWAGTRPLPPGAIHVPVSGTASSWREQKIWIQIEGEVKPEYIEAIRMVVGEEAPLKFEQVP